MMPSVMGRCAHKDLNPILAGTFRVVVPVFIAMFLEARASEGPFALACVGATAVAVTARVQR